MAYTQSDLEKIEQAIASGVTSVRYADGRQISYASVKELKLAKAEILKALNAGATAKGRPAPFSPNTSKGL